MAQGLILCCAMEIDVPEKRDHRAQLALFIPIFSCQCPSLRHLEVLWVHSAWPGARDAFEQLGKLRHRGAGKTRSILFQAGCFPPHLLHVAHGKECKRTTPGERRGAEASGWALCFSKEY